MSLLWTFTCTSVADPGCYLQSWIHFYPSQIPDPRSWIRISDTDLGSQISDFGSQIADLGSRISDLGTKNSKARNDTFINIINLLFDKCIYPPFWMNLRACLSMSQCATEKCALLDERCKTENSDFPAPFVHMHRLLSKSLCRGPLKYLHSSWYFDKKY